MHAAEKLTFDTAPDPEAVQAVRDGLEAFNRTRAPEHGYLPLNIVLRDQAGHVAGGLLGHTYWGWLGVEILWVAEESRGQGHGRTLLAMAEREARRRGCHHAHLDTMSFQARPFYEQAGYTVFGTLHNLPLGHSRYFLRKELTADVEDEFGALG